MAQNIAQEVSEDFKKKSCKNDVIRKIIVKVQLRKKKAPPKKQPRFN